MNGFYKTPEAEAVVGKWGFYDYYYRINPSIEKIYKLAAINDTSISEQDFNRALLTNIKSNLETPLKNFISRWKDRSLGIETELKAFNKTLFAYYSDPTPETYGNILNAILSVELYYVGATTEQPVIYELTKDFIANVLSPFDFTLGSNMNEDVSTILQEGQTL